MYKYQSISIWDVMLMPLCLIWFQDGSFLLRKSSGVDAQQPYTLVVFYNSRVYNIPLRYIASTKQYALGKEKQGEEVKTTWSIWTLNSHLKMKMLSLLILMSV